MRISLSVCGYELVALTLERDEQPDHEHDHLSAHLELAGDCPIGFHVPIIPSLDPD